MCVCVCVLMCAVCVCVCVWSVYVCPVFVFIVVYENANLYNDNVVWTGITREKGTYEDF